MSEPISQDHSVTFASILLKLNDCFGGLKLDYFFLDYPIINFISADKNGQNINMKTMLISPQIYK